MFEKAFGFITAEDGTDIFFHRNDLSGVVAASDIQRDIPVVFDVREKDGKRYAVHVHASNGATEEAYLINRFQGRVSCFKETKYGFISYLDGRRIFFHIADVNAAEDGIQHEPYEGCLVDFERGVRHGKEVAKDIFVTEWPQVEQTIEEYFESADAESESDPKPHSEPPIIESSSVLLKPENKKKTLLELIQERKQK
jgi:cold shock CspA family protein